MNLINKSVALFAIILCITTSSLAQDAKRNIVFILIDDLRYDTFGFMGHPIVETPNIDSIAQDGIIFERAFVTISLCSPSRATYLTSLYAHNHKVLDNSTRLNPELPTFPKLLQESGYETAFIGKWHMGGSSDEPRPGFDRWVSFKGQGNYFDQTFNIDGETKKIDGYNADVLTDFAEDFIKKVHDKPFMLYLSHKSVHGEFVPPERYKGCYDGKQHPHPASMANTEENYKGKPDWVKAQRDSWHGVDGMYNDTVDFDEFTQSYLECVRGVDDSVGRVMAALKEKGLLDSTLLVFTSDNGFLFGEHGLIDKRCMYEESIRIPLLARCPDLFTGNQKKTELITNLDIAPTFLEVAGVNIPESMQGMSFLPLLKGENMKWRDAFLYEYFWERSFPQTPTVLGIRGDKYKLMQFHGVWDYYEMYDLENDPKEMNNLLGGLTQGHGAGELDHHLNRLIENETVRTAYRDMREKLNQLINETGCLPEPEW